ncbi:MAG: Fic family protein [Chloroflexi bacterium]|nr:Fic family protein [Chloroflexota bacterium]
MKREAFDESQLKHLRQTREGHLAYFPPHVPRSVPVSSELLFDLSAADRALGELSGVGKRLRNPQMLIRPYLHREAVLSSRIEGTQSSLSDLLLFEADAELPDADDAREVVNYVRALESGIRRLPSLPISHRLVLSLHRLLLQGVRGENKRPGEFRTSQNWIGARGTPIEDADFVPPPPEALADALDDWERYIHEADNVPPLLRCALVHYQFETIHPFIDGNGRIGRLLMPLFLIERGCLSQPLLYLSAYFESNRSDYYTALSLGRLKGDLDPWLRLFLKAVETQSRDASARADEITKLEASYRERIKRSRSRVTHGMIDDLFMSMFVTAARVATRQKVTAVSARAAISELVGVDILREITGKNYGRVYVPPELLAILDRPAFRPAPTRSPRSQGPS